MRVILDAGHGSSSKPGAVFDPDTTKPGDEIVEKDINLEVALACGKLLRAKGHDVLFTRDKDVDISLTQRKNMINQFKPDAFISIHCNASVEHHSHGVEAFYRDSVDYPLAHMIEQALSGLTGLKSRGVFQDIGDLHKRLTVLDDSENTPACLVELGFLDSDEDRMYITKNMATVSEILADAIDGWAIQRGKV